MSKEEIKADLREQADNAFGGQTLTAEQRARMIDILSSDISVIFIEKQGEYVEAAVVDMMKHSINKKSYYAKKYGKEGNILPNADNYCVAIQQYGFYMASKDLGVEVNEEMKREGFELSPERKVEFYDERNKSVRDTIAGPVTSSCANLAEQGRIAGAFGYRNTSRLWDVVSNDGMVKKDANGVPLLKDGDLLIGTLGKSQHCVRVNVDENGKVTYTAGNGDHLRVNSPKSVGFNMGTPIQVFHSQDIVKQNLVQRFNCLTDEQLQILFTKYAQEQKKDISFLYSLNAKCGATR